MPSNPTKAPAVEMNNRILIICGPTATGKTALALQIAKQFNGELVSADSRQVYIGLDIITGKDLPLDLKSQSSNLKWRDRYLKFYEITGIKLWLTDIVYPHEDFNVSFWKECADLVIADILSRNKLPIIVGVTGLYIKSLTQNLSKISIPPDPLLRNKLIKKDANYLFDYLKRTDPATANSLNYSDRHNPRRLIRALEISLSGTTMNYEPTNYQPLLIGLSAPNSYMYQRIDARVDERLKLGAEQEARKYPRMDIASYRLWQSYFAGRETLDQIIQKWKFAEHRDFRHQLTWFKKQPHIQWFDISRSGWQNAIISLISSYAT